MCDPLTIAGMAISGVGSMLQAREQSRNMSRMVNAGNEATAENFRRQDEYQSKADEIFGDTLRKQGPAQQRQDEYRARASRGASSDAAIRQTGDFLPTMASAPKVVSDTAKKAVSSADRRSMASGRRAADVASLGDVLFGNELTRGRNQSKLGEVSSNARGVAALLPIERRAAANNAYKSPSVFPALLKGAGTLASTAGFAGYNPFGGPAPLHLGILPNATIGGYAP